jgi:rare lipoprotein A (peptidoglycan hydrolase)
MKITLLRNAFVLAFLVSFTSLSAQSEVGLARYYSDALQGQRTAYGEVYDRAQFTCNHIRYPQGTLLNVTRLDNNKSVVVRVNDRGPFRNDGSIIDVSMAAASALDLTRDGYAQVKVEYYGFGDNNAAASNYNTMNGASSNSFAYDRIFNGAGASNEPRPNEYNAPNASPNYNNTYNSGYQGSNNNNNNGYNNYPSNSGMAPKGGSASYGPVPPSYDRRNAPPAGNSNSGAPNNNYNNNYNNYNNYNSAPNSYGNLNVPNEYGHTGNSNPNPGAPAAMPSVRALNQLSGSGYTVQVASFSRADNASRELSEASGRGLNDVFLAEGPSGSGVVYKLMIGKFVTREEAIAHAAYLKKQFAYNGFVLRL